MSLTRRAALAGGGLAMLTGLPTVSQPGVAQPGIAQPVLAQPTPARAAYPSRTIKMIVPYPAGGTTDFLGRLVADQLKTGLGATVIVENKPGAATTLGAEQAAKAEPNGYTLLIATPPPLPINKTLYHNLPNNPLTH